MHSSGFVLPAKSEDRLLKNLNEVVTEYGSRRWSSEGATIFKLDMGYKYVLEPHRFAVLLSGNTESCFQWIGPDRYYVHVYQTKIEFERYDLRTLKFRKIAKYLAENFETLWP